MTTKTLQQQIIAAEEKLSRLRSREKTKDTRRKIIVGAIIIREALNSPASARKLSELISAQVTRDVDKADIASLVDELSRVQAEANPHHSPKDNA
jgi:hypothetical protein